MGKRIAVDQAVPGMILDEPVRESFGRVLFPEGSEVTDKTIRMLKTWGVIEISIKRSDESEQSMSPLESLDPVSVQEATSKIESLFKFVDRTNPLMEELFNLAVVYQVRARQKGASHV